MNEKRGEIEERKKGRKKKERKKGGNKKKKKMCVQKTICFLCVIPPCPLPSRGCAVTVHTV